VTYAASAPLIQSRVGRDASPAVSALVIPNPRAKSRTAPCQARDPSLSILSYSVPHLGVFGPVLYERGDQLFS